MWILLLEAGIALFLLLFIVWWTMFSGRNPDHPIPQQPLRDEKQDEKKE